MTIGLMFTLRKHYALLSDTMLSNRIDQKVPIVTSNKYPKTDDGYFTPGCIQKISIIRPYFIITWAGTRSEADKFICKLDLILPNKISSEEISNINCQIKILYESEIQFGTNLIYCIYCNGIYFPMSVPYVGMEIDSFKNVHMIGQHEDIFKLISTPLSGNPGIIDNSRAEVEKSLCIMAKILLNQFHFGLGIDKGWGGGFEIGFVGRDGTFKKIDRVIFRMWHFDKLRKIHRNPQCKSFYVRYIGTNLHTFRITETHTARSIIPSTLNTQCHIKSGFSFMERPDWVVDTFLELDSNSGPIYAIRNGSETLKCKIFISFCEENGMNIIEDEIFSQDDLYGALLNTIQP